MYPPIDPGSRGQGLATNLVHELRAALNRAVTARRQARAMAMLTKVLWPSWSKALVSGRGRVASFQEAARSLLTSILVRNRARVRIPVTPDYFFCRPQCGGSREREKKHDGRAFFFLVTLHGWRLPRTPPRAAAARAPPRVCAGGITRPRDDRPLGGAPRAAPPGGVTRAPPGPRRPVLGAGRGRFSESH